jgi:peptidyl-prolyl cis-trans isomerase C
MAENIGFVSKLGLGVLVLTLFAGCDLFKKKDAASSKEDGPGVTLLSINGKEVINEGDFKKHLTRMLQMNPYFRGAGLESLPAQIKRKVLDELVKQELIVAEAYKNKLESSEEFKKSLAEMVDLVKKSLLVQAWEKALLEGIKVEENEVKEDFEKNKDKYIKDPGGVLVSGIKFDSDAKALAFLIKAKEKIAEFANLAQKENAADFQNFGRVGEEVAGRGMPSAVPAEIKKRALSLKTLPAVVKVVSGKNFWVISVVDKKGKEFFALEEIKPQLENMLKNNKFRAVLETKLKDLEKEFAPVVNEGYFNPQPAEAPKAEQAQAPEAKEAGDVQVEETPAPAPSTAA